MAELKRAEDASAGGAKRLFDLHCEALNRYEDRVSKGFADELKQRGHLRFYRNLSVFCGTFLATGSLGLCAFAVQMHAELAPLAWVLGPVGGIAGVFVWGYRLKQPDEAPPREPKTPRLGGSPQSGVVTTQR